jgi:hypothetical protein
VGSAVVHYGSDGKEAETVVADRLDILVANCQALGGPQLWVLLAGYVVAVEHRVSWSFKGMATPLTPCGGTSQTHSVREEASVALWLLMP